MSEHGDNDKSFSPWQLYNQYLESAFINLNNESKDDGFSEFYEDCLDDLWGSIPSDYKQVFLKKWQDAEEIKAKDGAVQVERDRKKRERMNRKRQIITDAIAVNGWLYQFNRGGLMEHLKEMRKHGKSVKDLLGKSGLHL